MELGGKVHKGLFPGPRLVPNQSRNRLEISRERPSAELKGPRTLLRIRPKPFDLEPKSAPKPDEAKPMMPKAVPTNRHEPFPINFGAVSVCFGHDPKLLNCEIAQPIRRDMNERCLDSTTLEATNKIRLLGYPDPG